MQSACLALLPTTTPSPLRHVLGRGAPHKRVLELLEKALVDHLAEVLHAGAAAILTAMKRTTLRSGVGLVRGVRTDVAMRLVQFLLCSLEVEAVRCAMAGTKSCQHPPRPTPPTAGAQRAPTSASALSQLCSPPPTTHLPTHKPQLYTPQHHWVPKVGLVAHFLGEHPH